MQFATVLSYIGLGCSVILILALIVIAIVEFKSVNRVTIRLVAGLAFADFLAHINSILVIGTKQYVGTSYCAGLAAISTICRHLYAFTNIAISYHLYRAIVQLKKPSFKAELAIWIAIILIIGVLSIVYHFLGVFNGTINKKSCNPGANNPTITKVVFGLIGLFNFIAIGSGIFVTVVAHRYLEKWIENYFDRKSTDINRQQLKEEKLKATKRSFLYPLSSFITLTAEVILCAWMVLDDPPYTMFYINSIMTGFKGILTLIAFSMDQAVWNSAKTTYEKLKDIQLQNAEPISNKSI
jgi:hypothetical protein